MRDMERLKMRLKALQSSMCMSGPTERTGRALARLAEELPAAKELSDCYDELGPYARNWMVRDILCAGVDALK